MLIVPAIDLRKDRVVRLHKGSYDSVSVYEVDSDRIARDFIVQGARRLHVVLLWGSRDGVISGEEQTAVEGILRVRDTLAKDSCRVQLGGGIRRMDQINHFFDRGVDFLILGTALLILVALENGFSIGDIKRLYTRGGRRFHPENDVPDFELIERMSRSQKERMIVSLDYRPEGVGLSGWEVELPVEPLFLLEKCMEKGFRRFLLTNIERDGTLEGIDPDSLLTILQGVSRMRSRPEILVAGGIRDREDIQVLKTCSFPPDGVVIGKALYQGRVDFAKLISEFQAENPD